MINLIKRTFNLSGFNIQINPEKTVFMQGDQINCDFIISVNEYEITANKIAISLEESWTGNLEYTGLSNSSDDNRRINADSTVRVNRRTKIVGNNILVKPGDTKSFRFSAVLPKNCRLSSSSDSYGWCIVVNIDVPMAIDPIKRLSVDVIKTPHQ
jgi:hypothetical protein